MPLRAASSSACGSERMTRPKRAPREEAPDPRPTGKTGPMVVVEDGLRLSASRLWRLQRAFFAQTDPRAWAKSRVPSYITSNAFMARAVARVVGAFLEDVAAGRLGAFDASQPVHVVELGAGSGRFAYGALRELAAHQQSAARAGVRVRYVLTDLAPAGVAALREEPRFARFVEAGLLDFAVFDAEAPGDVRLLVSGEMLRAGKQANPLVVVANYFFDGIPADLFEVRGGLLRESHVRLTCPEGADPESPSTLGRFGVSFEPGPVAAAPYDDPALDALVVGLGERLAEGHFLFPVAGLRLLRHLRAMGAGRLLLLAADRGHVHEDSLLALDPPHLERHGSFSLDVNFHALALEAAATRGLAMLPAHHPTHLATTAFLWGARDAETTRTREAFERELAAGGPEDLFVLKGALQRQKDRLDVERALAWLRTSAWDPEVFHILAPTLLAAIPAAHPTVRLDVLDATRRAREAYYPIGEERDIPYALGELLDALDALPEAERAYEDSLTLYGPMPDTLHRLAGCALALHRHEDALARLEEALALDPAHDGARAMRVTVLAEMRRRPA